MWFPLAGGEKLPEFQGKIGANSLDWAILSIGRQSTVDYTVRDIPLSFWLVRIVVNVCLLAHLVVLLGCFCLLLLLLLPLLPWLLLALLLAYREEQNEFLALYVSSTLPTARLQTKPKKLDAWIDDIWSLNFHSNPSLGLQASGWRSRVLGSS